jgi:hypothetical protein
MVEAEAPLRDDGLDGFPALQGQQALLEVEADL